LGGSDDDEITLLVNNAVGLGGRPVRRYAWLVAATLALATATSGCAFGLHNLSFVNDTRLHFTAPRQRALVHLPVTITWTMSDFDVVSPGAELPSGHSGDSGDAGYFGVFVDRAPVHPGQTVTSVADHLCRVTPGCLTTTYLANRGVYTTTSDSITLTVLSLLNTYQKTQTHEVTVVLLNTAGQRIGESAWYIDFRFRASLS